MVKIINIIIKFLSGSKKISDGYHTFNELYNHRILLFIFICNYNDKAWKSKYYSDGTFYDNYFVMGLNENDGEQITYHIPFKYWDLCRCKKLERAPKFDGHTSYDVLNRLEQLIYDNIKNNEK